MAGPNPNPYQSPQPKTGFTGNTSPAMVAKNPPQSNGQPTPSAWQGTAPTTPTRGTAAQITAMQHPGQWTTGYTGTPFTGTATAAGQARAAASTAPPTPTVGTESGPGILEQWFNQRSTGTDPAYEYGLERGAQNINNEFAARGGYNSGAAIRAIGDMNANMTAQRESQLDALASGASGEHSRRLEDMFNQGLGLAGGQAGTAATYDTSAGKAMSDADLQQIQLQLAKAGVDQQTRQQIINTLTGLAKGGAAAAGSAGGGAGG